MPKKYSAQLPRDAASLALLKRTLAGYRRMNQLTEEEQRRRLPKMTEAESRREYEDLCEAWKQTRKYHPDPKGEARLDQLHIQYLIERRQLWDKIAQGKSLERIYIRHWLKEFSILLESNEALHRFEKAWAEGEKASFSF
jgi:hypothetical protein